MRARAVGSLAVAAVAVLTLSGCGNSGPGSTSGTSQPRTTTSSSLSTSSTVASVAASSSSVVVSLPVVPCQTDYGISTTTTSSLPPSVSVRVPSNEAHNLVVYADTQGILLLVGPHDGWTCHGLYGADGSGGLLISPVGEQVPNDPWGWHLVTGSDVQAIVGIESGGSDVQGAGLVCPLFASAASAYAQDNVGICPARSAEQAVTTISSVAVGFEDPAGVTGDGVPSGGQNAANAVALYQPRDNEPNAYIATCTLPASQHHLCTAVLNHFVAVYG